MIVYPPNLTIIFRPTSELAVYRGLGVNTEEQKEWTIARDKAKIILSSYPNNFRPKLIYPGEGTLVTAVLCTCGGREEFARKALIQFVGQTYSYKELVIVNQGDNWITNNDVPNVVEVKVHEGLTNGAMRNIGDGVARGEYIMRLDDDDMFSPKRMEMQMGAIKETGYPASSYSSYVNYLAGDDIMFEVIADDVLPGLLMYKKEGKRYEEDMEKGSDSMFLTNYPGLVVPVNNQPSDYVRVYHGENLSSKEFIFGQYRGNKKDLVNGARIINDKDAIPLLESLVQGLG